LKVALLALTVIASLMIGAPGVLAASQTSFNGVSSAVQNAFVAVQTAGRDGGNTTSLVVQLNGALALVQKATAENATNPGEATTDLQSALSIAQGVQSSAAAVARQGTSARHLQIELSVFSAVVIIDVAIALYVYGDRIYRRIWLRIYGGHVVKRIG
jgi:hypothetical protein